MSATGVVRSYQSEIAPGLTLVKQVTEQQTNYRVADQINSYFIQSTLPNEVDVSVDITGSEGAEFVCYASEKTQRTKTVTVTPQKQHSSNMKQEFCAIKLAGDWELSFKVTYQIKQATQKYNTQVQQFINEYQLSNKQSVQEDPTSSRSTGTLQHFEEINNQLQLQKSIWQKFPFNNVPLQDLIDRATQKNLQNFIDVEFPPIQSSLFSTMDRDENPFQKLGPIQWLRPKHIFKKTDEIRVFDDSITPQDIKQGCLGDCWLMSALGCIAERPELINKMFVEGSDEYSQLGVYRIRLYQQGKVCEVTIDDYIPCGKDGQPIFSRANGEELWVMLIEKAYAKLNGSYAALIGGYCDNAFRDLTGYPVDSFKIADFVSEIDKLHVIQKLCTFDAAGYSMSATTPGVFNPKGENLSLRELKADNSGLVPSHAYSLLRCVFIDQNTTLVQLRNPWADFEWNGAFSDNSKEWTPQLIQMLNPDFNSDDGIFWMEFKDFVKHFETITICRTSIQTDDKMEELRMRGDFIRFTPSASQMEFDFTSTVVSRFVYSFSIEKKQEVHLRIHLPDMRHTGIQQRFPYMAMGMALLKKKGPEGENLPDDQEELQDIYMQEDLTKSLQLVDSVDYNTERQVGLNCELEAGTYYILPRASNCSIVPPETQKKKAQLQAPMSLISTQHGGLTAITVSVLTAIFDRLDSIQCDGVLSWREFGQFMNRGFSGENWSKIRFKQEIIKHYCVTSKGELTLRGFLAFFKDLIAERGETSCLIALQKWGFDKNLWPTENRSFMMTIHSQGSVDVSVEQTLIMQQEQGSLDYEVNEQLIQLKMWTDLELIKQKGIIYENVPGYYQLLCHQHPLSFTFCFAVRNTTFDPNVLDLVLNKDKSKKKEMLYTFDCSKSQNMVLSEMHGSRVTKMVQPDETCLLMDVEGSFFAKEFQLAAQMFYQDATIAVNKQNSDGNLKDMLKRTGMSPRDQNKLVINQHNQDNYGMRQLDQSSILENSNEYSLRS